MPYTSVTSGLTYNYTLRVYQPILQQNPYIVGGYIPTTGTAVFRPRFGYDAVNWQPGGNYAISNQMQGAVASNGVQLLSNTTLTNATNWTTANAGGTGSTSISGGTMSITGDGTHQTCTYTPITTVVGRTYNVVATVASSNVWVSSANTAGCGATLLGQTYLVGTSGYSFVATATTTYIGFAITNATTTIINAPSVIWQGAFPTGWYGATSSNLGVTETIAATGTDGTTGYNYLDVTFAGTIGSSSLNASVNWAPNTGGPWMPFGLGQTATGSVYTKLVSGSTSGIAGGVRVNELNSSGGYDNGAGNSYEGSLTTTLTRTSYSYTAQSAASVWSAGAYILFFPGSGTYNFTQRFEAPVLEPGPNVNPTVPLTGVDSVIPSSKVFNGALSEFTSTNTIHNNTTQGAVAAVPITAQSISSITYSGTTATVTTSAAHGLAVGNIVNFTGQNPTVYQGAYSVASVPTSTTFTYTLAATPTGNATTVGAYTALTSGTQPTGWSGYNSGGIIVYVSGVGVDVDNFPYVRESWIGINESGSTVASSITFDNVASGIAAANGQAWTLSLYWSLFSGSASSNNFELNTFDSSDSYLSTVTLGAMVPTTTATNLQRVAQSVTLSGSTIGYIQPLVGVNVSPANSPNQTLQISFPQLEKLGAATSVIPTYGTAVTRNKDFYSLPQQYVTPCELGGSMWVEAEAIPTSFWSYPNFVGEAASSGEPLYLQSNGIGGTYNTSSILSTSNVATSGAVTKLAASFAATGRSLVMNGGTVATDTHVYTLPTGGLQLGGYGNGNGPLDGWFRRFRCGSGMLPSAQLQGLTR